MALSEIEKLERRYAENPHGLTFAPLAEIHRKNGDVGAQARALSEMARVQEYAGRPQESLRTCQEAVQWAREAGDDRLLAALRLRLADTLERLGDPAAARLHRAAAERMLGEELPESASGLERDANACEIRSTSDED